MSVESKNQAFEAKKKRWYVGGALAGAVVAIAGIAVIGLVDEEPEVPSMHVVAAAPKLAPPAAPAEEVETAQDPPAKEVFPEVKEEELALAHEDDGEGGVDHLARAEEAEKAGELDTAVGELRAQLDHTPDDAKVLWKLAGTAKDDTSDRALERLVQVAKADAEAPRELARRHLDRGDAKGAYPFAVEATKRESTSWEAWQLKGRALMGEDRLAPAILAFKKATEQSGAPSYPYNNLGYALLLAGRPSEALVALDTAVDRGPVTAFMMNNLGLAYERLGRLDEAEVAFLGALELKSDYVKAQVNLERVGTAKELIAKQEEEEKAAEAKDAESQAAQVEATEPAVPAAGAEQVPAGPLHGG